MFGRSLLLAAGLVASLLTSAAAQAPRAIPYQGTLTDGGAPVTVATSVAFDLFDAASGGTSVWSETQSVTPDADGRFAASLGTVTDLPSDFDQPLWLAVTADGTTLGPRTPLGAAPHALALYGVRVAPPTTAGNAPAIEAGHPSNVAGPGAVVSGGGAGPEATGFSQRNAALGSFSVIGGGAANVASGEYATIGGGFSQSARADNVTVSGGSFNEAYGLNSTVSGGLSNVAGLSLGSASGRYATVPGGHQNRAQGDYSFAAGRAARATFTGSFVWSDATSGSQFASTADNQFLINAAGGVGVGTNAPTSQLHVETDAFAAAVYGSNTRDAGIGVRGVTSATNGAGVFGESTASGTTYGVRGEIASTFGSGVYGVAGAGGGASGVYGRTTGGTGSGVLGQSNSSQGTGIRGLAVASSGLTYGVTGESRSTSGRALYGLATATTGTTYGVYGEVAAPGGYSGYFTGGRGIFVDGGSLGNGLFVENEGGNGINTATLFARNTSSTNGTTARFESSSNGQVVVAIQTGSGDLYRGIQSGNLRFRVQADGNVSADGTFTGGGADLAEYFPLASGAAAAPGQVVGLRGGRVSLSTDGAEQIAVISSNPAFVGNPDAQAGGALVALVGQVAVDVSGDVAPGDLLVASGAADGRARAVAPTAYVPADGAVLGRVLTAGADGVVALVGVDPAAALRGVVARQAGQIDALTERLARLEARLTP